MNYVNKAHIIINTNIRRDSHRVLISLFAVRQHRSYPARQLYSRLSIIHFIVRNLVLQQLVRSDVKKYKVLIKK